MIAAAPADPTRLAQLGAIARRQNRRHALLALPALLLLATLFAFPVLKLMATSLQDGSLEWYGKALGEGLYLEVYGTSFRIAATVSVLTFLISYPFAYFLATTSRFW